MRSEYAHRFFCRGIVYGIAQRDYVENIRRAVHRAHRVVLQPVDYLGGDEGFLRERQLGRRVHGVQRAAAHGRIYAGNVFIGEFGNLSQTVNCLFGLSGNLLDILYTPVSYALVQRLLLNTDNSDMSGIVGAESCSSHLHCRATYFERDYVFVVH